MCDGTIWQDKFMENIYMQKFMMKFNKPLHKYVQVQLLTQNSVVKQNYIKYRLSMLFEM